MGAASKECAGLVFICGVSKKPYFGSIIKVELYSYEKNISKG